MKMKTKDSNERLELLLDLTRGLSELKTLKGVCEILIINQWDQENVIAVIDRRMSVLSEELFSKGGIEREAKAKEYGYRCNSCGEVSDSLSSWDIHEDCIGCMRCKGTDVVPSNIHNGVQLQGNM